MHPLRLWKLIRRPADDRGAVATMVAILFGGGVLLGMTALTVDVGRLYAEREELQSGADSAAAAIAKACAADIAQCTQPTAEALAARYANSNAKDGTSGVLAVCGSGGALRACSVPLRGNLTDCYEDIPEGSNYVEVHTRTRQASGGSLLPGSFAKGILGNEGYNGTQVLACARTAWSTHPTSGTVTALVLPDCAFNESTANGTLSRGIEVAIPYRHVDQSYNCHQSGSGWGFIDNSGDCLAQAEVGGTVDDADFNGHGGSFRSAAATCSSTIQHAYETGTPVQVAVHSGFQWTAKKWYNVAGLANFVITGYAGVPGVPTERHPGDCDCNDPAQGCVYGYFIDDATPTN